jgi:hypothetical protein
MLLFHAFFHIHWNWIDELTTVWSGILSIYFIDQESQKKERLWLDVLNSNIIRLEELIDGWVDIDKENSKNQRNITVSKKRTELLEATS